MEWDVVGCGLEVEFFDRVEIEEFVVCVVEGVNFCDGFKGIGCLYIFFFLCVLGRKYFYFYFFVFLIEIFFYFIYVFGDG